MAKPGDPFETEELEEQRLRQRRDLRMVQDWIVLQIAKDVPLRKAPDEEKVLVESELRTFADKEREAVDAGLLERMARAETAAVVLPMLIEIEGNDFGSGAALAELVEEYRQAKKNRVSEMPEYSPSLIRMVAFMLWADELAGDYRDPRLD